MGYCWYFFILLMLYITSFMVMIVAALLTALACWMLLDWSTFVVSYVDERPNYKLTLFFILTTAIFLALVGLMSCFGACKKSRRLLMGSFCITLVIIVVEIALLVWVMFNMDRLRDLLKSNLIYSIKNEYDTIEYRKQIIDTFQHGFECCGATGPADWASSKYANKDPTLPFNLTVSGMISSNTYNVPESCCKVTDKNVCNDARQMKIGGVVNSAIYYEGCIDKLMPELSRQVTIVGMICIGIGVLEFIFACANAILRQMLSREIYKA